MVMKWAGILGLIIAVGFWQRHDGALSERVMWETREAQQNAANAKAIQAAEEKARQKENASAKRIQVVARDYERRLTNARNKYKSIDDAVASGTFQLRDRDATTVCSNNSGSPEATASTGGHNGSQGADLSPSLVRFLWFQATNADSVVEQLTACQAVVEADRK